MGQAGPFNWARHKPRKQWADISPKQLGRSRPRIFFGVGLGHTLARPKGNVNYLQNMNSGSHSPRNQNGCKNWRLMEEQLTQSRSLSSDQEA